MEQTNAQETLGQKPSRTKVFLENVAYIGAAIILAMLVQQFLIRPFIVNGGSMEPTLDTGHYLLIDRLSYKLHSPERGDVIIFKAPPEPGKYFVKRVIGLPGETVKIDGTAVTIINKEYPKGFVLKEPFILYEKTDNISVVVPEGQYFVMGDNRAGSYDSRGWGTLPEENISGRALIRLLPLSKIDYLPGKVTYQ